jgi:hypothetical protein
MRCELQVMNVVEFAFPFLPRASVAAMHEQEQQPFNLTQ